MGPPGHVNAAGRQKIPDCAVGCEVFFFFFLSFGSFSYFDGTFVPKLAPSLAFTDVFMRL